MSEKQPLYSRFNANLPRSRTRSRQTTKIKTFSRKFFREFDAIWPWAAKCWMPLSVSRVVNALFCSNELYCILDKSGVAIAGATKAMNMREWNCYSLSIFPPLHPHAINRITSTHRHFVLSPVSLALSDQDVGPSNSTIDMYHLKEKLGGCEKK